MADTSNTVIRVNTRQWYCIHRLLSSPRLVLLSSIPLFLLLPLSLFFTSAFLNFLRFFLPLSVCFLFTSFSSFSSSYSGPFCGRPLLRKLNLLIRVPWKKKKQQKKKKTNTGRLQQFPLYILTPSLFIYPYASRQ